MPVIKCEYCGKEFNQPSDKIKHNEYNYCSRICAGAARRRGQVLRCKMCGKEFYRSRAHISKGKPPFCSRACSYAYRRSQRPTWICETCGKDFTSPPSKTRKYCSNECRAEAFKGEGNPIYVEPIEIVCDYCGKQFSVPPSVAERGKRFCSKECMSEAMRTEFAGDKNPNWVEHIDKICEECGKPFNVPPSEEGRRFCSRECWNKARSKEICGENHPRWNGGKVTYYGPNWHRQRRKARKRDDYTCQVCNATEEQLEREHDVHHIIPFREFGIERYKEANALSNLVSLCATCHRNVEEGNISLP